ncbi:hypothetical protein CH35J_010260 [Colletotrichum higginsianum]|uniref:Uncharacterized protein n=1 Tax=Colletotrichum higginsianum TaxID=80884 RepID=A0A4T0VKM5_9PEZI|nr:hypothetical protein CH35J_010260 [Colletotrichum higginsianum]
MKTSAVSRRIHSREPDVNSLELSSLTLPQHEISQQIEGSPLHLSVGQPVRKSQRRDPEQQDITERSEPDAETSLLNEGGASKEEIPNRHSAPARWNALGFVGLCIIVLGTIVILAATAFLAYLWQSSMRARAGQSQGSNGGLWDLIVLSNWTSVTVTLTAAVIRVCLALQMGVLTGMIASLLIEKSGVPMGSAPFVSILRAVSASPYHLVSRAALTTPFAIAVGLGVLLTGASQFTSTALLFDFDLANITTPKQTVVLPYGSSQPENPSVDGNNSPVGTL